MSGRPVYDGYKMDEIHALQKRIKELTEQHEKDVFLMDVRQTNEYNAEKKVRDLQEQVKAAEEDAERLMDVIENALESIHYKNCANYRDPKKECDCGADKAIAIHRTRLAKKEQG